MNDTFEPHAALHDRGLAVGCADITRDEMHFWFHDEKFDFPTIAVHGIATFNGYFYTAPIDALRKLEAESAGG